MASMLAVMRRSQDWTVSRNSSIEESFRQDQILADRQALSIADHLSRESSMALQHGTNELGAGQ